MTPSRPRPNGCHPDPPVRGARDIARLPRTDEVSSVDVAVLGVPFDSGVSYRPGARFGPGHIPCLLQAFAPL